MVDETSPLRTVVEKGGGDAFVEKLPPGPGLAPEQVAAHQRARIRRATIEIVGEHGYQALKVRDLVRLAGVSTRAFYEHFSSKEDCFLRTYELISKRATWRIIGSQADERDWRERSRLVYKEFAGQLEKDPNSARLVLVEAHAAGPASLEQVWRAERTFEGMLAESFARAPGIVVPPLVVEGMVAGVARVARTRLLANRITQLDELGDELVQWLLNYPSEAAGSLAELNGQTVWRNTMLEPLPGSPGSGDGEAWPSTGDRALILDAVAKLAVADGYANLTPSRIRATASVPRSKFNAYFDGVEDCFLAALEQKAAEAFAQAARAQTAGRSWAGGVYRAIAALCEYIAADQFLASVCLADDFPPGSRGARTRQRLITAVAEQLGDGAPREARPSALAAEASAGAVWAVFHHHAIRDWAQRRQIAATLSYLALAPAVGAGAAVAAIRSEQTA